MIEYIINLASYGSYGGEVGSILNDLEQAGFFSYVLPFLLIFAIIYGILNTMKIFENKNGINAIISLAVSLMALQTGLVSEFFNEITPLIGIGLVILLGVLIFLGFLAPKESWVIYSIFAIAVLVFFNILLNVAESMNSPWINLWYQYKPVVIGGIVIGLIILIIVNAGKDKKDKTDVGEILNSVYKRIFK